MSNAVASRRFCAVYGFRFRLLPIVLSGLLMEGMLRLGRMPAKWLYLNGPESWDGRVWMYVGLAILFQALLGLAGILVMKKMLPQADAHLRWPPGRSYAGLALVIGLAMGAVMLSADYGPQFLGFAPFEAPYPVNAVDSTGWLAAMAITGLAEETIFRGLLVGMLVVFVPGRIRVGAVDLPIAGVIVAVQFGVAHWQSFMVDPLYMALAQQTYAFVWGLIYVWLMERSRSLVAPIIAHGAGNAFEVGLVMLATVLLV